MNWFLIGVGCGVLFVAFVYLFAIALCRAAAKPVPPSRPRTRK